MTKRRHADNDSILPPNVEHSPELRRATSAVRECGSEAARAAAIEVLSELALETLAGTVTAARHDAVVLTLTTLAELGRQEG